MREAEVDREDDPPRVVRLEPRDDVRPGPVLPEHREDGALRRHPPAQEKPLAEDPRQTSELVLDVLPAVRGEVVSLLVPDEGVVGVPPLEHPKRLRLAPDVEPVRRGLRVAVAEELLQGCPVVAEGPVQGLPLPELPLVRFLPVDRVVLRREESVLLVHPADDDLGSVRVAVLGPVLPVDPLPARAEERRVPRRRGPSPRTSRGPTASGSSASSGGSAAATPGYCSAIAWSLWRSATDFPVPAGPARRSSSSGAVCASRFAPRNRGRLVPGPCGPEEAPVESRRATGEPVGLSSRPGHPLALPPALRSPATPPPSSP